MTSLSPLPVEEEDCLSQLPVQEKRKSPTFMDFRVTTGCGDFPEGDPWVTLPFPFASQGKGCLNNFACECDGLFPLPVEEKAPSMSKKNETHDLLKSALLCSAVLCSTPLRSALLCSALLWASRRQAGSYLAPPLGKAGAGLVWNERARRR